MAKKIFTNLSNHAVCRTLTGLTINQIGKSDVQGRIRQYQKAENIWQADDKADGIFFLRQGKVAILACDADGRETVLRTVEEGEPFGELCFCAEKDSNRLNQARALTSSEALEIKFTGFIEYLREHREELLSFVFTFCTRLSNAEKRIEILAFRSAEDRIGWLLVQLAESSGETGGTVELQTSHKELAQMAAMSRSHVTVTLGNFRRRNLIDYGRNLPFKVNLSALKEFLIDGKLER